MAVTCLVTKLSTVPTERDEFETCFQGTGMADAFMIHGQDSSFFLRTLAPCFSAARNDCKFGLLGLGT